VTRVSSTMEDYLEAMYRLELLRGAVHVKDIADLLNVKMPSVTSALHTLQDNDFIAYEKYKAIRFTTTGRAIARDVYVRHQALREFLTDILQLDPCTAEQEACEMEHAVSGETMKRLLTLIDFIKRCPRGGEDWLQHLKDRWEGELCDDDCATCIAGLDIPSRSPFAPLNDDAELISLDQLEPGHRGIITRLGGSGPIRRRIMDMGITTGSELEVERLAPLGDPMEFKIRGYHLSLRREEAANIYVRLP